MCPPAAGLQVLWGSWGISHLSQHGAPSPGPGSPGLDVPAQTAGGPAVHSEPHRHDRGLGVSVQVQVVLPLTGFFCATAHAHGPERVLEGPEDAGMGRQVGARSRC